MTLLGNYYGTPAKPVTVLAGIRNAVGAGARRCSTRAAPTSWRAGRIRARSPAIDAAYLRPRRAARERACAANTSAAASCRATPLLTRVDAAVDFRWDRVSPTADLVARGELPADRALANDDFSRALDGPARCRPSPAATR